MLVPRIKTLTEEVQELDQQLVHLKDRRARVQAELTRFRKMLYEPATFERRGAAGQGLFVHTRYILPYITEWVTVYNSEHGKGGRLMLQKKSGVHAKSIRSYFNGTITYVGILSADRLLTAIGKDAILDSLPFLTVAEIKAQRRNPAIPQPPHDKYFEE